MKTHIEITIVLCYTALILTAMRQKVHCAVQYIQRPDNSDANSTYQGPRSKEAPLIRRRPSPTLLTHSRIYPRRALFRTCLIVAEGRTPIAQQIAREPRARQRTYQTRLVVGRLTLLVHLEDRQHKDLRIGLVEGRLIPPADHFQKLGGQIRAWVQLNVAGKYVEGGRRLARNVASHVHRVQQLLLVLVHLCEADVHPWRPERAVIRVGDDLLRWRYLR